MKFRSTTFILTIFTFLLFSCDIFENDVIPSNKVTSRFEDFSGYDMIEASHAFQVYIRFSDTEESIEIEANENLHQYIVVKKENKALHIGLEQNTHVKGNATLKAYIKTKHVDSFTGSGATIIVLEDDLVSTDGHIYLSGASEFKGYMEVTNLNCDISGASLIDISGSSKYTEIEASGASNFKDYRFTTDNLQAELSGASNITIFVNEEIDVEASGASVLRFKGTANIAKQELSGASSIKDMN